MTANSNSAPEYVAPKATSFPATLPLAGLIAAVMASFIVYPSIALADRVSVSVGWAIGWSLTAYIGYRIAVWRNFQRAALTAWVLLALGVVVGVWNGLSS